MSLLDIFRPTPAPLPKPIQDVHLELPGAMTMEINHTLRFAVVYHDDPDVADTAYDELEAHLKAQGYVLLVIASPVQNRHR